MYIITDKEIMLLLVDSTKTWMGAIMTLYDGDTV